MPAFLPAQAYPGGRLKFISANPASRSALSVRLQVHEAAHPATVRGSPSGAIMHQHMQPVCLRKRAPSYSCD